MKKTHRDITVDDIQYTWKADCYGDGVTVWQKRKEVFYHHIGGDGSITPSFVASLIRKFIKDGTTYNERILNVGNVDYRIELKYDAFIVSNMNRERLILGHWNRVDSPKPVRHEDQLAKVVVAIKDHVGMVSNSSEIEDTVVYERLTKLISEHHLDAVMYERQARICDSSNDEYGAHTQRQLSEQSVIMTAQLRQLRDENFYYEKGSK